MRIPGCLQNVTAICVPTERFTAGSEIRGRMSVPFRELREGKEKNAPEALMLVTAAVLCAGLPGTPVDILPALDGMGFRTGTIRRTTKAEYVCEGRVSEMQISDSRIASYLCGDSTLLEKTRFAWKNGQLCRMTDEEIRTFQSQSGTHYAACDREGNVVYLGVISVESGAVPCMETMDQLAFLQHQGIRVVLSRRPGRNEYHPGLQVICKDEEIPLVEDISFVDWVNAKNKIAARNRLFAALAAIMIPSAIVILILLK